MKYFLFTFLACCSAISIGSGSVLSRAADLFCTLATHFDTMTPKPDPFKISGFDCKTFCKRSDISVDITIQCDVGRKPENKKLIELSTAMAKSYTELFFNMNCDPELYISVKAQNTNNTVGITGVC